MKLPLYLLVVEDSEDDVQLLLRWLRQEGFEPEYEQVATAEALQTALDRREWDIVIADYLLPGFSGLDALKIVKRARPHLPFIMVSGRLGEELAVEVMKAGAQDFITKDRLARIAPTVRRELEAARARQEREHAQTALRLSEESYRALVENSLQGILIFQDGRIVYANKALADILGYTVDEILAMLPEQVREMAYEEDRAFAFENIRKRLAGYDVPAPSHNYRIVRKDGAVRWIDSFASRIEYRGRPAVQAFVIDITGRKQSEELLQASEQRFRMMVQHMPILVNAFDKDGTFIFWNRECERVTGYSAREIIGNPQALELLYPNETYRRQILAEWEERGNTFSDWEIVLTSKDGSPKIISWSNISDHVPVPGWSNWAIGVNVTRRYAAQQSQQEIKTALQAMHAITSTVAPFEEKIQQLLKLGCRWFKLPVGILSHVEGEQYTVVEVVASTGSISKGDVFPLGSTYCSVTLAQAGPVGFEDAVGTNWQTHPCFSGFKLRAYFGSRVMVRGRVFGTLNFSGFDPRGEAFTATDEAILGLMTQWVGGEIARNQSEAQIRRRNRELALLNRVIAASAAGWDPETVLQTACRELALAFDAPLSVAALLNEDKTGVVIVAEHRPKDHPSVLYEVIPVKDNPVIRHIFEEKKPLVTEDAQHDPRVAAVKNLIRRRHTASMLIVPVLVDEEVVGSLSLATTKPRRFLDDEVNLVLSVAGQVGGVLARARLAQTHRRLITAIEQTADSVIVTDAGGSIVYVNPAFERVTGYSRAEVMGRNPRFLKSGRQETSFYRELWAALNAGQVWHGRFVNRKKDGTLYTEESTISPVRDENGQIINFVSVQRDVTRELELEEQYRQAQKMDAVGRLTGGIAHDFNNLLTAINGFAELARNSMATTDPHRELVDKILYSGRRAADLVGQLLAFSRKQVTEPRVLVLNTVVAEMDKMLRRIIGEAILIETDLQPNLWPVKADPAQIQQVILNLAINARDAMPDGGRLAIETANVVLLPEQTAGLPGLEPGEYVLLAVSDTGVGMSRAVQARIFEPFFTTKEVGKGTGLGLSTVYGIVRQSGGSILCESEEGMGTSFSVYLPAEKDAVVPPVQDEQVDAIPQGEETVLVVEDDPLVRELAADTLRMQGYTVLEASNGHKALELVQTGGQEIHLLLTDVVMPRMNGRALLEQVKEIRPNIKVIFLSGYSGDIPGDGVPLITKPFSPTYLARKVREVLDK